MKLPEKYTVTYENGRYVVRLNGIFVTSAETKKKAAEQAEAWIEKLWHTKNNP